jgi:type I restriction enzyme S subunit
LELEIDMPMPPLAEQERMVMLLDEASELRTLRAEADAHAAKLIPALFHEMFGKPTTDSAKWPVSTLGEVCSFIGGSSLPSGEPFSGQPDGLLLLKVGDMNEPGNDTSITSSREWIAARKSTYSQAGKGTIIIPKRGGSIATNKKRMLTRDALLDPNLMGIAPRTEMLSESYLFEWFRLFDLTRIASGSSVPQLNKQDLAPLRIAIPPLDVQGEFSELASEIREMEFAQAASREQLNALYHSTLHRVFKREL